MEENFIFTVYNFIPEITNIIDVPNDQGGRVYLSFNASHFDNGESSEQMYSVFRYDYFEDGSSGWVGVQSIVAQEMNHIFMKYKLLLIQPLKVMESLILKLSLL